MERFSLNGMWWMTDPTGEDTPGSVPGSVYSFFLDAEKMQDPYWADNELKALKLMEGDYTFRKEFHVPEAFLERDHLAIRFEGIDTLSDVYLNGAHLGSTDNMHLFWEYDVKGILREGANCLKVCIKSPTKYIAEKDEEYHLGGTTDAMRGFPHLRKAHCMFGWDWGPRLPDAGIWKDVTLLGWDRSRIEDIRIDQVHTMPDGKAAMGDPAHAQAAHEGKVGVGLTVTVTQSADDPVRITLTSPDGESWELKNGESFTVPGPRLWWPNGLGGQPLYTVRAELLRQDASGSGAAAVRRIGLRTCTMRRRKDPWGETFMAEVNGRSFFSMGADYIPEDCILSRITAQRTRALLRDCVKANFNVIRVWGGGFYPFDFFYDLFVMRWACSSGRILCSPAQITG